MKRDGRPRDDESTGQGTTGEVEEPEPELVLVAPDDPGEEQLGVFRHL
jgi:hypothetical protein